MRMRFTGFFLALAALAQTLSFDVASVKPSPDSPGSRLTRAGSAGNPPSEGIYSCRRCSLMALIMKAYDMPALQIAGPDWLSSNTYDIQARMPQGTSGQQLILMLQSLLEERFQVAVHHEMREQQVYELTVGRTAPRLTVSSSDPPLGEIPHGVLKLGDDGLPVVPATRTSFWTRADRARYQAVGETTDQFANILSSPCLNRPISARMAG